MNREVLKNLYLLRAMGYKFIDESTISSSKNLTPKSIDELNYEIKNCNLCALKNSSKHSICGFGDTKSEMMFIAFEPTSSDDSSGEFLSGVLGSKLCEMSKISLNLNRGEFYFSSLLRCKSSQNFSQNEAILRCKPYIFEEIKIINASVIVALGEEVFINLGGQINGSFESVRGSFFKFKNATLMPTFSLLSVVKNPSLEAKFLADLEKLKGLI